MMAKQQQRPTTAKIEKGNSLSPRPEKRQRDSSIDEFEKLEQACSKPADQRTQQLASFKQKSLENNQKLKNRKLFDDDSDQSEPDTKDARTDIVKKMFYKQEEQQKPRITH